jgi:hypothetical protein
MSNILEFETEIEICDKQCEFLNRFLEFTLEHELIIEKDVDEIKKIYHGFKEYRINETQKESDSLKYILNNINTIKEKEINGITIFKKPYDYRYEDTNKSMHPNRCVIKLGNSVFKIFKFHKNSALCWNWNKINTVSTEIYFNRLSINLIQNSEIKNMVVAPETYKYGTFKNGNESYYFVETEFIEDELSNKVFRHIENRDEIINLLSIFFSKYKKCIGFINTSLSLYCIDDAKTSKYIFGIDDISDEIEKVGVHGFLNRCYIIRNINNNKNELVFNSNVYISNEDKLVLVDFDSYSRTNVTKYYFFRLFEVVWKNEIYKNWQ